jgi:hypothetical protein
MLIINTANDSREATEAAIASNMIGEWTSDEGKKINVEGANTGTVFSPRTVSCIERNDLSWEIVISADIVASRRIAVAAESDAAAAVQALSSPLEGAWSIGAIKDENYYDVGNNKLLKNITVISCYKQT